MGGVSTRKFIGQILALAFATGILGECGEALGRRKRNMDASFEYSVNHNVLYMPLHDKIFKLFYINLLTNLISSSICLD
jgi:hypothetical protein